MNCLTYHLPARWRHPDNRGVDDRHRDDRGADDRKIAHWITLGTLVDLVAHIVPELQRRRCPRRLPARNPSRAPLLRALDSAAVPFARQAGIRNSSAVVEAPTSGVAGGLRDALLSSLARIATAAADLGFETALTSPGAGATTPGWSPRC